MNKDDFNLYLNETIEEDIKKESEGETKNMSGYSYFDKQNGKLLTVAALLDGYYPPRFNFNISTFVNGKIDKTNNKSWAPLKLANVKTLIANLSDPNTYGPFDVQEGKIHIYVGLSSDGCSFTSGTDDRYQTLILSEEGKEYLIHYLQMWMQFGTLFKDLYDNITDKIAKDTENMLKDLARKMGYNNIESLSRFDESSNNNSYVNKKKSYGGQQNNNYSGPPQRPTAPVPPSNIPQMPIPGTTSTGHPIPTPPAYVEVNQMPVPPMPSKPNMGAVPPTPSAPSFQQPPKMPNMGMSIPQTPNSPNADFGNQLNDMLKSAFNN